jgi:carbohydrate diacid regulator
LPKTIVRTHNGVGERMAVVPDQFERVADTVMERTAELLGARVTVVDASGTVIASSEPGMEGMHIVPSEEDDGYLRVPLHLHNARGEVLIEYGGGGEVISPRLARVMAELIINQAAVVDRLPNKLELKNKFIHDLLHGGEGEDGSILREAQILGMDLTAPRLVMLIDASHYILDAHGGEAPEAVIRRRSQLIIGTVVDFFHLPNDTICAYIGEGEVAILKASSSSALDDWASPDGQQPLSPSWANLTALKRAGAGLLTRLRNDTHSDISLGIGRYHPGISGLSRSYSDARAALLLGCRFQGQNRVHCLDGLGIAAFVGVSDEATKVDLATHLLSPIAHEPDLLETLETFFGHDCSPSSTAQSLSIHRNTLAYRLDKITLLTGLDPRRFDDAVQMRLALTLSALPADEAVHLPS